MQVNTIRLSEPTRRSDCAREDAILAQVDTIYPVALQFTADERLASLLTEKTVLAALRDRERIAAPGNAIKPAMLSLLRATYLKSRGTPA